VKADAVAGGNKRYFWRRRFGECRRQQQTPMKRMVRFHSGGFFSGGYVTMLTPIFVVCFGMTVVQAVANTKLVNIFSSLVATLIFIWCSIVDYRLGLILAVTAFIGARIALKLDNLWLRRIFLATVVALALKTLIYDFVGQQLL
jgi:uncharacterized protein